MILYVLFSLRGREVGIEICTFFYGKTRTEREGVAPKRRVRTLWTAPYSLQNEFSAPYIEFYRDFMIFPNQENNVNQTFYQIRFKNGFLIVSVFAAILNNIAILTTFRNLLWHVHSTI